MYISLSTITTVWILLDVTDLVLSQDREALDIVFRGRTRSDWEKVWHHESHTRCRDKLVQHLYWACEKDIYRLSRRNSAMLRSSGDQQKRSPIVLTASGRPLWLDENEAKTLLRTRRSRRRIGGGSITAECCTRTGCTWEEYAEYCPTNKRVA